MNNRNYTNTGIASVLGLLLCFIFSYSPLSAQSQLNLAIGGPADDMGRAVVQTSDGGYVIAGETKSGAGGLDAFFTKIDSKGVTLGTRIVGGTADDYVHSLILTKDSGFAATGWTNSFGNKGDVYVIKLDKNGIVEWTRAVGTVTGKEMAEQIIQTADGGYAIAGSTDVDGADMYLVKLKGDGSLEWDKKIGQLKGANSVTDNGFALTEAHGGGYVICGNTYWFTGVVATSSTEFYAVKVDASGNFVWGSVLRDPFSDINGNDYSRSIIKTDDGGYVIAGDFARKNSSGAFNWKYGLLKLNGDGSLAWTRCFGSPTNDNNARQIIATKDKGFAVIGGMSHPTLGLREHYMVKFNSGGNVEWNKTFGSTLYGDWLGTPKSYPDGNEGYGIIQTADDGYAIAGYLNDNNITNGVEDNEVHFVKFDASINNCITSSSIGDMFTVGGTIASIGSSANVGGISRTVTDENSAPIWVVTDFCNSTLDITLSSTPVLCSSPCSGSATVTVTSGKSPYNYQWSTGLTVAAATGLCAGTYSVVVTDASSSSIAKSVVIADAPAISSNASSTNASCGLDNGTATVNVTGGTTPYTYSWNTLPVQTTATATGLAAGTYTVTVTDAGSCSTTSSATIISSGGSVPASVTVSASSNNICAGTLVTFTATPLNGGTPPDYQWKLNGANTGTNSDTFSSSSLSNNDEITCVMTSSLVCATGSPATSNTIKMTVTENPVAGVISAVRDTICSGTPASLKVTGSSGNIQWQSSPENANFLDISSINTDTYTTIPAQTTYYRVYTTNGNCSDTSASYAIVVMPSPVATYTHSGTGLTLDFNSSGTSGDVTNYEWDFGDGSSSSEENPSHTYSASGIYKVCLTVYNGSNCSFTNCKDLDVGSTGISGVTVKNNRNIYPNPFNDFITIESEQNSSAITSVEVYDVLGRLVLNVFPEANHSHQKISINTSALTQGIYFLKVKFDTGNQVYKILKEVK